MATAPSPVLSRGDDGPAVTKLQEGLTRLGFDAGPGDGVFGRLTEAALREFQLAVGVDVDGMYGRRSEDALRERLDLLTPLERLEPFGRGVAPMEKGSVARGSPGTVWVTGSVMAIADRRDGLTAIEIARSLWDDHADYPARTTIVSRVGEEGTSGVARPGREWVDSVLDLLDPGRIADPRDRVLHGKLLIYGLSKLDEPLRRYLVDSDVLDELRRAITPDPETLFRPESRQASPGQPSQSARLIADTPATEDLLDREGFANALAVLIDVQRTDVRDPVSGPILVHLYGAWGSGKTTVFELLRRSLETPAEGLERGGQGWLCVTFNAWRHQRTAPPWWWLMDGLYREARSRRRRGDLTPLARWRRLRIWAWWWGFALAALLAAAALLVSTVILGIVTIDRMTGAKDAVNVVVGLFVAAGSALALLRSTKSSLLVGSPRAATALLRTGGDPYRRIKNRYAKLVDKTGRHVLLFVDDLDRCQPDYVVELLEGIQTIFDDTSVTYLVAADRDWVSESFQQVYADLGGVMGRPGRPLGYLFLEKTFAVSAPLPRPSSAAQTRYWQSVLSGDTLTPMETVTADDRRAADELMADDNPEQAAARAASLPSTDLSGQARALRENAAIKVAEAVATGAQDHVLAPYLPLLEPNPRALKRLRNAYAIATMGRFASLDIATTDQEIDSLIRWTILSLRWPQLASRLTEQPGSLHVFRHPDEGELGPALAALTTDDDLRQLLDEPVANGVAPALDRWLLTELGRAR